MPLLIGLLLTAIGRFSLCLGVTLAEDTSPAGTSQRLITLPVRIVNEAGDPVAGVEIAPWALRSSQGHGQWSAERTGYPQPAKVKSGADGLVEFEYPYYANPKEHVLTTQVTLSVDHPDYVFESHHNMNVPYEADKPHQIELKQGVTVEIEPIENGKPADLENLHCRWSDGRSWLSGATPTVTEQGTFRIPPLPEGKNQVILVRLKGERATHFSRIDSFEAKKGETVLRRLELKPAVRVTGRLSDNVPRPVKNGRVSVCSLPEHHQFQNVIWWSWTPVAENGTFVIDRWPATEPMQVTALTQDFIARSGDPPAGIEPPEQDPHERPQVFAPDHFSVELNIDMVPMIRCEIEVVDHREQPVGGAKIFSNPNVGWWNIGSQIYCDSLCRSERLLIEKDFEAAIEQHGVVPFRAETDAQGRASLFLPVGKKHLGVWHDQLELPVARGSRRQQVELIEGETAHVRLELQPQGKEFLGEWDKLAGVLFGCTGEECRRLMTDDGFRSRIERVRDRYAASDDPTDPALLTGAYSMISEAFAEMGDKKEARLWRRKSKEQAEKLKSEDH